MPHMIQHANWQLFWEIPLLPGGGLVIKDARFQTTRVLFNASQPFVLVPYHGGRPQYKDGLGYKCGGVPLRALTPIAPNANSRNLDRQRHWATNDGAYNASSNPGGAVLVEKSRRTLTEPETLTLTAKFGVGNYQYVQRWSFRADGAIHPEVGLAGQLFPADPGRAHKHHFYFRLDFDVVDRNNVVERFEHQGNAIGDDKWIPVPAEAKQSFDPTRFARWRVRHKSLTNAARGDHFRSYEIILGSDGGPDASFSTGDIWAVRFKQGAETGEDVGTNPFGCTDDILTTRYANGPSGPEPLNGDDLVLWCCLRTHHFPREKGEETKVVPYHFMGFHIEPRDFLNATPSGLYATDPPSP